MLARWQGIEAAVGLRVLVDDEGGGTALRQHGIGGRSAAPVLALFRGKEKEGAEQLPARSGLHRKAQRLVRVHRLLPEDRAAVEHGETEIEQAHIGAQEIFGAQAGLDRERLKEARDLAHVERGHPAIHLTDGKLDIVPKPLALFLALLFFKENRESVLKPIRSIVRPIVSSWEFSLLSGAVLLFLLFAKTLSEFLAVLFWFVAGALALFLCGAIALQYYLELFS